MNQEEAACSLSAFIPRATASKCHEHTGNSEAERTLAIKYDRCANHIPKLAV